MLEVATIYWIFSTINAIDIYKLALPENRGSLGALMIDIYFKNYSSKEQRENAFYRPCGEDNGV